MEQPIKMIERYNFLSEEIIKPEVISNTKEWQKLVKEHAKLSEIVNVCFDFEKAEKALKTCEEAIKTETDAEMKTLLEEEIKASKEKMASLDEEYKVLLLPEDENDDANVIMEIRGAAGGEESSLFAGVLMRMYNMYCATRGWKTEILSINETELGGIKEVQMIINGKGAFKRLKFESGVHRVQRVPETEAQGRVHTSTATVAVLPEVKDVEFEIHDKDVRIDTYCSSGAGGQHVNKTESAVRLTHLPTGIVVTCQDERNLIQNKEKAFNVLKSKLYDYYKSQSDSEYEANRKNQVGTGDRSERIRTYNYPQGRVSDHRINLTLYSLDKFVNGDLDEMLDALQMDYQRKLLEVSQN